MARYKHLFGLRGCAIVYSESDKPPTKDEMYDIWLEGYDSNNEDIDATHIETYEIDDDYEEVKEIIIKETR